MGFLPMLRETRYHGHCWWCVIGIWPQSTSLLQIYMNTIVRDCQFSHGWLSVVMVISTGYSWVPHSHLHCCWGCGHSCCCGGCSCLHCCGGCSHLFHCGGCGYLCHCGGCSHFCSYAYSICIIVEVAHAVVCTVVEVVVICIAVICIALEVVVVCVIVEVFVWLLWRLWLLLQLCLQHLHHHCGGSTWSCLHHCGGCTWSHLHHCGGCTCSCGGCGHLCHVGCSHLSCCGGCGHLCHCGGFCLIVVDVVVIIVAVVLAAFASLWRLCLRSFALL